MPIEISMLGGPLHRCQARRPIACAIVDCERLAQDLQRMFPEDIRCKEALADHSRDGDVRAARPLQSSRRARRLSCLGA